MSFTATPTNKLGLLPLDIIYHIESFCDVLDLIALRRVCLPNIEQFDHDFNENFQCDKHLEAVSREKVIWAQALLRTCIQLQLFIPSFPVESMDYKQLESAATAYIRFPRQASKAFRSSARGSMEPVITRYIQSNIEFRAVTVAHGGRYLLALAGNELQLWDLGTEIHGALPEKPLCTATTSVSTDVPVITAVQFPQYEDFLIIRVVENSGSPLRSYTGLFKIHPAVSRPEFEELACLNTTQFNAISSAYEYTSGVVAFLDNNEPKIHLWHIDSGSVTTWQVSDTWNLLLCSNSVLRLSSNLLSMDVLRLPSPEDLASGSAVPPANAIPGVTWWSEVASIPSPLFNICFSHWDPSWNHYRPASESRRIDVICSSLPDATTTIFHKILLPSKVQTSIDANGRSVEMEQVIPITVHRGTYRDLFIPADVDPSMTTMPDGTRLIWWMSGDDDSLLDMHISSIAPSLPSSSSSMTPSQVEDSYCGQLYEKEGGISWENHSLSAATGRLCIAEGSVVKVLDYLEPLRDVNKES